MYNFVCSVLHEVMPRLAFTLWGRQPDLFTYSSLLRTQGNDPDRCTAIYDAKHHVWDVRCCNLSYTYDTMSITIIMCVYNIRKRTMIVCAYI